MSTQPEKKAQAAGQSDKILVATLPPYGRAYEGALSRLSRDRSILVKECDTQMDAVTLLRAADFAVLLCHSSTPEELVKQVNLLKLLAPQIKQKRLRVMATTAVKHESAATSLNFYGATEMLTEPISEKALQFKLERMARSLAQVKARVAQAAGTEAHEAAAKKEVESDSGKRATPQFVRRPALTLASDFWITAEIEVKRIRDRWLIHLVGPAPDFGRWMKVPGEPSGRQGTFLWQWVPTEPEGRALYKEQGEWFYRGQRPEFQELEWLFVGIAPELFFKGGDGAVAKKIHTDEKANLLVARDSQATQALIPLVKDSLMNMGKKTFRKKKEEEDGDVEDLREREAGAKRKKRISKEEAEDALEIKEVPALKFASDCWVIADRKPKRIASRWVARMLGPTPDHGRWDRMGSSDLVWAWEPNKPVGEDPFIQEQGTWVFRGLPPKFQEDRWLFVADKPGLAFVQGGKNLGSKLATDAGGNLLIAKDSEQATARLPLIEECLKKIFKGKAEEESASKTKGDAEHAAELEEVLEAEAKEKHAEEEEQSQAEVEAEHEQEQGHEQESELTDDEDTDEDEIVIESRRKKRRDQVEDDELVAKPAKADRDEEELELPEDEEDEHSEDAVAEEEGARKRRRKAAPGEESEELYAVQKGAGPGQELSIEVSPDDPGKELEAIQEGPGEGKLLSAETSGEESGDDLEATEESEEGEELEATEGRKKKKSGSVTYETEEAEDLGKVTREDEEPEDLGKVTQSADEENDPGEVKEDKPVRPEDAKGIRAPGPPGPTLSPLALAFLMAELVNDRTKNLPYGASRFCAYLSSSCGGLQIELWCKSGGGWVCAATSENPGQAHEIEAAAVDQDPATKLHGEDTLVSAIRYKGQVVGALVIHGHGTDGVKHDYAEAAARVACGMTFSLSSSANAKAA